MVKIKQVWQSLISKPQQQLEKAEDIVESGAEVSKAVLEFAIALGVLTTAPAAPVIAAGLSFVGIARKGLTSLREKTNKEFEIEEWVALACPLAYINSFNALVQRNVWLKSKLSAEIKEQEVKPQFNQLKEVELSNSEAKEALTDFSNSILGQALNQELSTYLEIKGISSEVASLVTGWVAWDTYNYIKQLLSYEPEDVVQALNLAITAAPEIRANEKYASIESYLKEQISPSPRDPILIERWKVIGEDFTIPKIYVSLEAELLDSNDKPKQNKSAVNLENWVKEQLNKAEKNDQVIFIQAGPGRGKSVFCKMFANWVREHLHPVWTPLLIRLRDIDAFEPNIENTLRAAVRESFTNRDDWLSDRNTRYLFILDGFDELRFEGRTAKGIEDFIGQVGNYQAQTGCRHKFIVTGRESALHGIENRIPTNLEKVEIALMDDRLQKQWLEQWGALFGQDKAEGFQKFIEAKNCPERVKELGREPLLLYLLAAMHRDNELTIKMFEGASGTQAKIIIYQTMLDWVLTKQRPEKLNQQLTEFDTEDLRLILTEAGLCVTQSGREWTSIKTIEERLKSDKSAREMLEKAQQNLGENPLRNALAAFYLRPAKASESTEGAVEFIHKSFGEFLCAQKIAESFERWIKVEQKGKREIFVINDDEQVAKEIYDLLSYGGLTQEIVDYLIALIDANKQFQHLKLFERLEYFYECWYRGEFINAQSESLPLNQMRKFQTHNITLGLREVDIYTGLNVIILLLELHRYVKNKDELKDNIVFYPCGKENTDNFDNQRLLLIVNYSNSITLNTFSATVGYFLSGAHLEGANLRGANLNGANLNGAHLEGAHLEGANLKSAHLRGANLNGANLNGAHLEGAHLNGTNLNGANLEGAHLSSAHLRGAYLRRTYLRGANLEDVNLEGAYLEGAYLEGAYLEGAYLLGANLKGANLEGANLDGANLDGANLEGAYLDGAYLDGANLEGANLEGAYLDGANLRGALLSSANLRGANLDGAKLSNITWDEHTNWKDARGLDKAQNIPEGLLNIANSTAQPSALPNTPPSA
ncbi:pentapeptide repeat-containing protein [Nostoc sp. PA-18-2419]|uniref:pentapeptide repeat-containing protein n=1 Tax=Nostoc sp. PA-18-2419 TaxID=2575443 RepID=UPI001CB9D437|nr:pentapeptide repeat-containing protein [Nostoc sp. PA-18-2419]